jgi:DNA polymerase-3 subunit gamma/tau
MRTLWREAALAALLCGTTGACAAPHYPIYEGEARGPAPLSAPRPQYPINEAATPSPPAVAPVASQPAQPPTAAPVAPVTSQPLAPPQPGAAAANDRTGAKLEHANYAAEAATDAGVAPTSQTPAGQTAPAAGDQTGSSPASPALSAPEPQLTPQMVLHDQPAPAPTASSQPAPSQPPGPPPPWPSPSPRRSADP